MTADEDRFAAHDAAWRDPAAVAALWGGGGAVDPALLDFTTEGPWWDLLEASDATLLVGREYEHLLLALGARAACPRISFLPLPHPTGIAVDAVRGEVHVASTRNPNVVLTLRPASGLQDRGDLEAPGNHGRPLMPASLRFLPGCSYLHDLAMLDGVLHATATGSNAIIALPRDGEPHRVWWPDSIDDAGFGLNQLQLNGIAAGASLDRSFFSASAAAPGATRPGDPAFPVDGRGVIFSGATRAPILHGLTRPHSPRFVDSRLWLANSGYGTVLAAEGGHAEIVARLPGWTRGLCRIGHYVIAGTSRVLPRFSGYAPGLDPAACRCGLHAIEVATGRVAASLTWPAGNQIFAIEALPAALADGLPFRAPRGTTPGAAERTLFYAWRH